MRRLLPAVLTVAALAIPASAAAAWTAPAALVAPGTLVEAPQVAAASDGSAIAAFGRDGHVWAVLKLPGAAFGAPQDLGPGTDAQVAMQGEGRAVVAWRETGGFRVATREASSAVVTADPQLTAVPGISQLAAAAGANGRLYVAAGSPMSARLYTLAPGASSAGSAVISHGTAGLTSLAVATQGTGDIAWLLVTDRAPTYGQTLVTRWSAAIGAATPRSLQLDSDTSTTTEVGTTTTSYRPAQATAIGGAHPSFLWTREVAKSGFLGGVTSALFRVDDPIPATPAPAVVDLGSSTGPLSYSRARPVSTEGPDGSAAAVWSSASGTLALLTSKMFVSVRQPGGLPGPALPLDTLTTPFAEPKVYAYAAASGGAGATDVTYAINGKLATAHLDAAGALTTSEPTILPTPVDAGADQIDAAGTGTGDTVSVWNTHGVAPSALAQVAYDDVTPPTLTTQELFASPAVQSYVADQAGLDAFNAVARTLTFDASASDLWTPTTITWDFGDGATATGEHVTHAFGVSGTVTVTITARDLAGNATTKVVRPTIPTPIVRAATPPTTPGPPTAKVVVGIVKLSSSKFAVVKGKPSAKKGTTVSYSLNAAARVEISVLRPTKGYRSGKSCVAKRPKGKTARRCTFDQRLGLAGVPSGVAGANTFAFDGRVAGRLLKPGRYKLVIAAIASGQTHGTNPVTTTFTVTK